MPQEREGGERSRVLGHLPTSPGWVDLGGRGARERAGKGRKSLASPELYRVKQRVCL